MAGNEVQAVEPGEVPAVPDSGGEPTILGLMQAAVAHGKDAETIERLAALLERHQAKEAEKAYNAAMVRFQNACPVIVKTKRVLNRDNTHRYNFAPLEVVARTMRPHLDAHGFSYQFTQTGYEAGAVTIQIEVRHVAGHRETHSITLPIDAGPGMNKTQASVSAVSYGKRQALVMAFGVTVGDEDDDGAGGNGNREYITDEQHANLETLLSEVGADEARFLKFFNIDQLAHLPRGRYEEANRLLEEKRRRG